MVVVDGDDDREEYGMEVGFFGWAEEVGPWIGEVGLDMVRMNET